MEDTEELFNDNVDYLDYVNEKNYEFYLGLNYDDIKKIADLYVKELIANNLDYEEEILEDDKLLLSIVRDYKSNLDVLEDDRCFDEDLIDLKLKHEKQINSMGGYAFIDSFNDFSCEDRNVEFALRFRKK